MATSSPTVSTAPSTPRDRAHQAQGVTTEWVEVTTAPSTLRDRADYLPREAQLLRRRIAFLYHELFCLAEEATQECERNYDVGLTQEETDIWDSLGMIPDDIRGYAQRAELRVPVRYPAEASRRLKRAAIFEQPGVMGWYLANGREFPRTCQYLEAVDHIRLLTLDYIKRFDPLTVDLKSF